jgi:hypothetical protein
MVPKYQTSARRKQRKIRVNALEIEANLGSPDGERCQIYVLDSRSSGAERTKPRIQTPNASASEAYATDLWERGDTRRIERELGTPVRPVTRTTGATLWLRLTA